MILKRLSIIALPLSAVLIRLWCVAQADLPSGDEINSYISNGQTMAGGFHLPSLDAFPLTAFVYGAIILSIDFFSTTLSGVVASRLLTLLAGALSVWFLYRGIKTISSRIMGIAAGITVAVFSGTLLVFRADISLYYILMPMLSFSLISYVERPTLLRAIWPGSLGALFYMSRSDGLIIFCISLSAFLILFPKIWKGLLIAALMFVVTISAFLGLKFFMDGNIGGITQDRAIMAFYQAEGLHDRKGGSWHDYSARGLKRFGPPKKYKNSMIILVLKNIDAVFARIKKNLSIILYYFVLTTSMSWWIGIFLVIVALFSKYWKIVALFAAPCILTSCIYLVFYFQASYFTMLSYGLAIWMACGAMALADIILRPIPKIWARRLLIQPVIPILLIVFLLWHTVQLFPDRITSADRYWNALVFIKENCQPGQPDCFFAKPYRGSRAMYIFVNRPNYSVEYGKVAQKPNGKIIEMLQQGKVRYLLCGREDEKLWFPESPKKNIVFMNRWNDVKVVALE